MCRINSFFIIVCVSEYYKVICFFVCKLRE
nr:MAG TPA: hypothetical protein [Caudoviricetes sp.]